MFVGACTFIKSESYFKWNGIVDFPSSIIFFICSARSPFFSFLIYFRISMCSVFTLVHIKFTFEMKFYMDYNVILHFSLLIWLYCVLDATQTHYALPRTVYTTERIAEQSSKWSKSFHKINWLDWSVFQVEWLLFLFFFKERFFIHYSFQFYKLEKKWKTNIIGTNIYRDWRK